MPDHQRGVSLTAPVGRGAAALQRQVVPLEPPLPFHGRALLVFFGRHAVPGIEAYLEVGAEVHYSRTLRLPGGPAVIELSWSGDRLSAALQLTDARDADVGRQRIEQLCDLAVDIAAAEADLACDDELRPLLQASPGLRVPGVVDVHEHLFRTVIGQQISLAGAANCAGKIVRSFGDPVLTSGLEVDTVAGLLSRLFPTAGALAAADPETLPMPRARGRAVVGLGEALSTGALVLTRDSDPVEVRRALLARRGIGPWTADYVLMRALHQRDILLGSDLVIQRELIRRGMPDSDRWAPWRSYATMHLWRAVTG